MEWFKRRRMNSEKIQLNSNKSAKLIREVWKAHKDLQAAEMKLNEAVGSDQIDYAIYITEAAEKRLNMLIKEAKVQQIELDEYNVEFPVSVKKNTLDV